MTLTSSLTVDGEILAETRGGADRDYLPDPLGSTAALLDESQAMTDAFAYWPYGEERSRTGSTPTPFTYVGTLGYYRDQAGRLYVRARTYLTKHARWLTVDPLWPTESAYRYGNADPTIFIDPSGLSVSLVTVPGRMAGLSYWHAYIQFSKPCNGSTSWGFSRVPNPQMGDRGRRCWTTSWNDPNPGGGRTDPYPGPGIEPGVVMAPDPYARDYPGCEHPEAPRHLVSAYDKAFEDALCSCIVNALKSVPFYGIPGLSPYRQCYTCGTWAHDMWECAESKLGRKPKSSRPRPIFPKVGPIGQTPGPNPRLP